MVRRRWAVLHIQVEAVEGRTLVQEGEELRMTGVVLLDTPVEDSLAAAVAEDSLVEGMDYATVVEVDRALEEVRRIVLQGCRRAADIVVGDKTYSAVEEGIDSVEELD